MDLEIEAGIVKVAELLRSVGFTSVESSFCGKLQAKQKKGLGRLHILGLEVGGGKVYVDVHWDSPVHLAFLGVDYSKRPRDICNKILDQASTSEVKARVTGGSNWFNRRNKAILRGIRV
ncbi:MAG: hypothetical protein QXJ75_00145 [Candidatus Bathyarchaeia archaeon]